MKNNSGSWLGFLAGVAVGAGLYAFLSSKEGKAWLHRMKQAAHDFGEDLENLAAQAMAEAEEEAEETSEKQAKNI